MSLKDAAPPFLGAKARARCDELDRKMRLRQKLARLFEPHAFDIVRRRLPCLGAKDAREIAFAHVRSGSQGLDVERLANVIGNPAKEFRKLAIFVGAYRQMDAELRLAA